MTGTEEASHKGTPHSGVVEPAAPGDLEQPTGPPGEVAHLDESNGEPQRGEVVRESAFPWPSVSLCH